MTIKQLVTDGRNRKGVGLSVHLLCFMIYMVISAGIHGTSMCSDRQCRLDHRIIDPINLLFNNCVNVALSGLTIKIDMAILNCIIGRGSLWSVQVKHFAKYFGGDITYYSILMRYGYYV